MNQYQINKIIRAFFGSSTMSSKGLIVIAMIVVSFAWFPDGLSALLEKIFSGKFFEWDLEDGTMFVQIFGSILMIYLVVKLIRKSVSSVEIKINEGPKKAEALVLFLSNNKKLDELKSINSFEDFEKEPYKDNSYKMPMIAIDYHKNTLKYINVFYSEKSDPQKDNFAETVENIFGESIKDMIKFKEIGDFEDAKIVYDGLDEILKELKKLGIKEDDVVFDVTGGQKVVAIAGALFAIPDNRHLQYVSTTDHKLRHYDLTYAPEDEK
ncbi:MAG: hypothetical protein LUC34_05760 [Campylobacter sp.]|nr:hypothetical protein [Campylobacter sp.]